MKRSAGVSVTTGHRCQGRRGEAVLGTANPRGRRQRRPGVSENIRQRPTLPGPCGPSTIGAEGLNCSVRNGKRCFPLAMATGNLARPSSATLENRSQSLENVPRKIIRQALDPLVPVSFAHRCASRSGLSPGGLPGVLLPQGDGRAHLEAGFPLRCLQRLSDPHVANLRCPWQDNRYTRGAFIPVLSY
jgi:hypothetical protein